MTSAYRLSWLWSAAATLCAAALVFAAGGNVAPGGALKTMAVLGPLALAHILYRRLRPDPVIADATGALVCAAWAAMMGGIISLMGIRLGAPLIDAGLAAADAALGLDATDFVTWTAERPWLGKLLAIAYLSSFPLLAAAIVHLSITRRSERLWELVHGFVATLTVATLVSAAAPAIGAFAHYGISDAVLASLPQGAGVYHLAAFEGYRSGALATVDFERLQGVVTFPSIHTCLALATAYAYRDHRWLRRPALLWNTLVLVSTIPIGGHYYVDLIAGAALFAISAAVLRTGTQRAGVRRDVAVNARS